MSDLKKPLNDNKPKIRFFKSGVSKLISDFADLYGQPELDGKSQFLETARVNELRTSERLESVAQIRKIPSNESDDCLLCPQCQERTWRLNHYCIHCEYDLRAHEARERAFLEYNNLKKIEICLLIILIPLFSMLFISLGIEKIFGIEAYYTTKAQIIGAIGSVVILFIHTSIKAKIGGLHKIINKLEF